MNRIEKSILCAFLAAVLAMTVTDYTVFAKQCGDIRQKVFRLHILANSDSTADQALKLKVRDKILEASPQLFDGASGKAGAEEAARANLDKIKEIAAQEIAAEGYDYPVDAQVVNMYFTTRTYGDVTLPAGNYDALRITIGQAKGHNWWCVLFPPLCLPSSQGEETLKKALGPGEAGIVIGGKQNIVLKFKTLEMIDSAKRSVSSAIARVTGKKPK